MYKFSLKLTSFMLAALLLCLSASAYSVTRRGDRNADGKIELADVMQTLKDIVGNTATLQSDMNGDGKVTLADIVRALRYSTLSSDFTQNTELFTPGDDAYIYNYCPSVMQMENGDRYVYYCTNRDPLVIVDYIGCRVGTPVNGTYSYGAETIVFSPSADGWDSLHVCDPSVIQGDFTFNGTHYAYLMAYLGCNTGDNTTNQIGLAVSNDPNGTFTRVSVDEPFIAHPTLGTNWGTGQPSLVSAEPGSGIVYLFYTEGIASGTMTRVEKWDLTDLNNPQNLEGSSRQKLDVTNLKNLNNKQDFIRNADFAYDPESKSFYMAKGGEPFDTSSYPNYISDKFVVCYSAKESPLVKQSWNTLEVVEPSDTGYERNHDVGLVRDAYGWLPSGHTVTVFYSRGDSTGRDTSRHLYSGGYAYTQFTEWTYRIHEYTMVK